MATMTSREFLTAIASNETLAEDVRAFAEAELAKRDAANEKRRNTPSKKAVENEPLVAQIVDEILTNEPKTASDVAAVLGVSVQKASTLLRSAVTAGKAVSTDIKVPKKGVQKGYTLPVEG